MGFKDIYLETTDSTNRVARELGEQGAAHGSGVAAGAQSAGRGRLGRTWFSPPGKNLYCSYVVRPNIVLEDFPKLTMVAGLAAVRCVQQISTAPIGLKWPNDLYVNSRKCGGILCESSATPGNAFAVIGFGINCNLRAADIPEELRQTATSLLAEGQAMVDIGQLYADLRRHLLQVITEFEQKGFAHILAGWNTHDLFRGMQMTWISEDRQPVTGFSLGPDLDGALLVEDADGKRHKVISGDVNLADS